MASLSASQIMGYAKGAGLNTAQAIIATAVAFAESGGDPQDHYRPGTGEDSYGLWQINLDPRYRASRMSELGITSPTQLYDPATNAHAMAVISNHGANWNPWTTYTGGKYKQFLSQAQAASGAASITGSGGEAMKTIGSQPNTDQTMSSFQGISDLGDKLLAMTNVQNIGLRVTAGMLGFVLIVSGILFFAWGN